MTHLGLSLVVVDASVLIDVLCGIGPVAGRADAALDSHRLAAPEQLFVETFNGIRGRALGRKIGAAAATRAVARLARTSVELVPTTLLLGRMWELRDNLSGYDAAYVAAAEHLGVPLVTSDKGLASAPGLRCEVRTP